MGYKYENIFTHNHIHYNVSNKLGLNLNENQLKFQKEKLSKRESQNIKNIKLNSEIEISKKIKMSPNNTSKKADFREREKIFFQESSENRDRVQNNDKTNLKNYRKIFYSPQKVSKFSKAIHLMPDRKMNLRKCFVNFNFYSFFW